MATKVIIQVEKCKEEKNFSCYMPELVFEFRYDIGSFFDYFSYLNINGVAKKAGINASLMRQYAMGIHEPSKKRKQQILDCLHGISKELQAVVI